MNVKNYIGEICLMIICLGIGIFEDKFVLPAFIITTIYNVLYVLVLRRFVGERFLESVSNIIWSGCDYKCIVYSDLSRSEEEMP